MLSLKAKKAALQKKSKANFRPLYTELYMMYMMCWDTAKGGGAPGTVSVGHLSTLLFQIYFPRG